MEFGKVHTTQNSEPKSAEKDDDHEKVFIFPENQPFSKNADSRSNFWRKHFSPNLIVITHNGVVFREGKTMGEWKI